MKIKVKNSIFDGTLLENIPVNYTWFKDRPSHVYTVGDDGITLANYKTWYDIHQYNTKEYLQKMFLHDMCHIILYCKQGLTNKIFKSDFGLSWDTSEIRDGVMYFSDINELKDEHKITMLGVLLHNSLNKKESIKQECVNNLMTEINYIWFKDEDINDPKTIERKRKSLSKAYDYWVKSPPETNIQACINKLRKIILENKKAP